MHCQLQCLKTVFPIENVYLNTIFGPILTPKHTQLAATCTILVITLIQSNQNIVMDEAPKCIAICSVLKLFFPIENGKIRTQFLGHLYLNSKTYIVGCYKYNSCYNLDSKQPKHCYGQKSKIHCHLQYFKTVYSLQNVFSNTFFELFSPVKIHSQLV